MSATADLTVIVVSYNTRELTLRALEALYSETVTTPLRTLVVDNASQDGSAAAIAQAFPEVEVIDPGTNLGFARANNLAAARATTPWILLLNPDTEIRDRAVDRLMAFARARPETRLFGGRTVFPDGRLNPTSCWARITPWSLIAKALGLTALFPQNPLCHPEAMPGWARDTAREVDIVSGCFLLIRRELWETLGGFDPRYFMYGEDADLCLRARALGHRALIAPEAEIMHLMGAASATRADKMVLLFRGRRTLIEDHWRPGWIPLGQALMWLWALSRVLVTAPLAWAPIGRARATLWRRIWAARRAWLAPYPRVAADGGDLHSTS